MRQHTTASRLFILTVSGIMGSLMGCSPEQTFAGPPAVNSQGGATQQSSSGAETGGQAYPTSGGTTSQGTTAAGQGGTETGGGASQGGGNATGGATHATGGAGNATGGKTGSTGGKTGSTGGSGTRATGGRSSTGGSRATGGAVTGDGGSVGTGGTPPSTSTTAANTGTTVTFSTSGKASGAMSGWSFVAAGATDVITSPTCGADGASITDTKNTPCNSSLTWSGTTGLCMTASVPKADTDYLSWGVSIGVNSTATDGGKLGQSFSTITYTFTGAPASVSPRGILTIGGVDYCVMGVVSGTAIQFTDFTKTCYDTTTPGAAVTATQVTSITKVMLQISADSAAPITVSDLCLTGIKFGA